MWLLLLFSSSPLPFAFGEPKKKKTPQVKRLYRGAFSNLASFVWTAPAVCSCSPDKHLSLGFQTQHVCFGRGCGSRAIGLAWGATLCQGCCWSGNTGEVEDTLTVWWWRGNSTLALKFTMYAAVQQQNWFQGREQREKSDESCLTPIAGGIHSSAVCKNVFGWWKLKKGKKNNNKKCASLCE